MCLKSKRGNLSNKLERDMTEKKDDKSTSAIGGVVLAGPGPGLIITVFISNGGNRNI